MQALRIPLRAFRFPAPACQRGPHQGDANCNGYCTGKSDDPPAATESQKIAHAKEMAHKAANAAEKAWYDYAVLLDVGSDRTRAFETYENIRNARRV